MKKKTKRSGPPKYKGFVEFRRAGLVCVQGRKWLYAVRGDDCGGFLAGRGSEVFAKVRSEERRVETNYRGEQSLNAPRKDMEALYAAAIAAIKRRNS